MKLYGYFRSSAAFRVRIALNLKKLDYESAFIHLRRGDQRQPSFRGVNPQGLVPALEIDGAVLVQSLPIIEYLDERYPSPPLLPNDPQDRAANAAIKLASPGSTCQRSSRAVLICLVVSNCIGTCCTRERIVGNNTPGSGAVSSRTTSGSGSSRVFNKQLAACTFISCMP